jgi:hypothetical protein
VITFEQRTVLYNEPTADSLRMGSGDAHDAPGDQADSG